MAIDTSILEDIGLTNAQIKTYLALLELGETTTGPVIKKSGLQNSVVYNALSQLIEQGLVTFVLKGKRKHFSATSPKNLVKYVGDKKRRLEALLPELLIRQTLSRSKQEARVFLGWRGVYSAYNSILEILPKGADYIAFSAGLEEYFTKRTVMFFKNFQRRRAEMKYKVKLVANESSREHAKEFIDGPGNIQFRFVPGYAPVGMVIFGDNVLHVAFGENPVAVIISSRQIAFTTKRFFHAMWKIGKK